MFQHLNRHHFSLQCSSLLFFNVYFHTLSKSIVFVHECLYSPIKKDLRFTAEAGVYLIAIISFPLSLQILQEVMEADNLPPPPAHLMALSQELEVC